MGCLVVFLVCLQLSLVTIGLPLRPYPEWHAYQRICVTCFTGVLLVALVWLDVQLLHVLGLDMLLGIAEEGCTIIKVNSLGQVLLWLGEVAHHVFVMLLR